MATSVVRALQLTTLLVLVNIAQAAVDPPPAYKQIALPKGVPAEVLYSVALTESKVLLRGEYVPWPWTLNVAGKSYYYATRTAACTALLAAINLYGAKSVDSGLGQVNIGWNGHRFSSPCESLDPYKNLDATSDILIEQRDALYASAPGRPVDWIQVAGRYHRPAGGAPAAKYRRTVSRHLSQVLGVNLLVTNP
ncbi:lytic transglycosylase domain-containing protein [Pseudomonas aeruginosa]|uniref:lytic transglycosylase domain-containing protein n=1 Tax=Pseudomonas aeruginosa TaxID=287 RepID=UPI000FF5D982|nr:lytic transglycosylase domain-containing protein [Pseudomonas aeruginosa]RPX12337.1 lytic transglycosylase [Pseudomonas aeruginosa]TEO05392.1 lytic transglycosylase domain-containing protein [Pseudomonas aeruginosa]TEO06498.1 lytic transglycosylase domain-containing protein [Pseudomonas aeruginosa]TEO11830.1 lytic transglycosylase domain-containing protein [Pseudomonas aeruginosa]WCW83064.1 lytic transglycosylase domain-containing protein [Pseudomonas aeruginosa]